MGRCAMKMLPSTAKMVLDPDALYISDNGRILHGRCSGMSAQFTGRDISGQPVMPVTEDMVAEWKATYDIPLVCEHCALSKGGTR